MIKKITIKNLTKKFDNYKVLDNISLDIFEGEFLCIVGPSGCGKTTLLRILGGFESYEGEILIDEKKVIESSPSYLLVFQEFDQLFPWKNVFKNVEFGLGLKELEGRKEIVKKYIKLVGLEGFEKSYPHQISGGMKQRVAIARALIMNPSVLLMDEPFGSLDAEMRRNLGNELIDIWSKVKITIVFVTHNIREAIFLGSRILVLGKDGKIKDVIEVNLPRPRDPTSKDFGRIWKRIIGKVTV